MASAFPYFSEGKKPCVQSLMCSLFICIKEKIQYFSVFYLGEKGIVVDIGADCARAAAMLEQKGL